MHGSKRECMDYQGESGTSDPKLPRVSFREIAGEPTGGGQLWRNACPSPQPVWGRDGVGWGERFSVVSLSWLPPFSNPTAPQIPGKASERSRQAAYLERQLERLPIPENQAEHNVHIKAFQLTVLGALKQLFIPLLPEKRSSAPGSRQHNFHKTARCWQDHLSSKDKL